MRQRWDIHFDYKLDIDTDMAVCLARVDEFRNSIARIPIPPDMAHEFNKINIVRQIRGTTGIEGNTMTEEQVAEAYDRLISQKDEPAANYKKTIEQTEVENTIIVQRYIKQLAKELGDPPLITERVIKELHQLTTQNLETYSNKPGQYRSIPVGAGDYEAPEPIFLPELMEKFVITVNDPNLIEKGPVIRAMVAHFYLVTIHPFADGNGRTSRAVEALILYCSKYNARGFYSLANYFYKNRDRYIVELQEARFKYDGNLTSFVKFALDGLVEEMHGIQEEILQYLRKTMFLNYIEAAATQRMITTRQFSIVHFLARYGETIQLGLLRERKHPVLAGLYQDIKTAKTIDRDIDALKKWQLITIENGVIQANIDIMENFEG